MAPEMLVCQLMRKSFAANLAKLSKALCKSLKLGSGSTVPGRVALAINPKILDDYYKEIQNKTINHESISINVTGTNGKTTSTGMLKKILSGKEYKPIICNDLGANLYFGIAGAFVSSSNFTGDLTTPNHILEVDEAALASVTKSLKPKIIAVTNLFRDQLDRFGELDTTQKLINKGIENANNPTSFQGTQGPILVLNADDPYVAGLGTEEHHKVFYSVEYDESYLKKSKVNNQQIKNFDASTSQHLRRVEPHEVSIKAKVFEEGFDSSLIKLETPIGEIDISINLPGLYNVYNACTAAAAAYVHYDSLFDLDSSHKAIETVTSKQNNLTNHGKAKIQEQSTLQSKPREILEKIKWGIENYQTNFGRAEAKLVNGVFNQTFLIKNPTGASEVCKHLSKDPDANFLIIINDNYADGRDVSWLWDAEFEHIAQAFIKEQSKQKKYSSQQISTDIEPTKPEDINDLKKQQSSNTQESYGNCLKKTPKIFISGHRAYDMATRLKYAGIESRYLEVIPSIAEALAVANASLSQASLNSTTQSKSVGDESNLSPKLYILPTYTALLELEKLG